MVSLIQALDPRTKMLVESSLQRGDGKRAAGQCISSLQHGKARGGAEVAVSDPNLSQAVNLILEGLNAQPYNLESIDRAAKMLTSDETALGQGLHDYCVDILQQMQAK